jgi:hypothetical protein
VFLIPESPRRRRHLFWLSVSACVVVSAAAVIVLLPKGHAIPERVSNEPAQVAEQGSTRLSPVDRRRIAATLDRFLVAALDRRDPAAAWALAGPGLRGSSTLADWAAGKMPIPVYPARGAHFRGWSQLDVSPDSVSFNLIVQPRAGSKSGALALAVQVVRSADTWVVDSLYPVASFTPVGERPHVVGPNDFGPVGRGQPAAAGGTLDVAWIAVPVGLFLVGLLVVMLVVGRNWLRYRRARKAFAGRRTETMPSLPSSPRRPADPSRSE